MNTRMFLFRSSVTTTLPFGVLVNYLKRKTAQGVRFKLGYIDKEDIDIYYSYSGDYDRLGLSRIPNMQVITNDKMVADGLVTDSLARGTRGRPKRNTYFAKRIQ